MPLLKKSLAKRKSKEAAVARKKVAVAAPKRVSRKKAILAASGGTFNPVISKENQRVEESKYYTGPVMQKFAEEKPFEFPIGYGDNRIVLMIRDPHWLHSYWEVNDKRKDEIIAEIGLESFRRSREILRVYDTENWSSFDIDIAGGAKNWYIHVPVANRTYCVEIGYLTADGRFIAAARSNWVTTPRDSMSDVIDEQWMIPDWERIYALSGGFGIGRGSEEIREMIKKRFEQEISSGWVSSLSSPSRKIAGERPFWLVANCELIVYGATEPSATVTIQGRKIALREDGTFSLRFSLPDGKQTIPIEATRDDGAERRRITPKVERRTE